jgi:predicted CoA-binding protein
VHRMTPDEALQAAESILLVDWPSRDVPDTLTRAGYAVITSEGPGPDEYVAYGLEGNEVVTRPSGGAPERAEIVYSHRPIDELPEIVDLAKQVGATTVWCETGSSAARDIVESSGIGYADTSIVETVQQLAPRS